MSNDTEYEVTIKLRNNNLLRAIKRSGKTIVQLAAELKVQPPTIYQYLNIKKSPLDVHGDFVGFIWRLAAALNEHPENLFTGQQLKGLFKSKVTREMSEKDLNDYAASLTQSAEMPLLEYISEKEVDQLQAGIASILDKLRPTHREVIKARFGIDQPEETLEEIGKRFGMTRERVRQIELTAIAQLRHPANTRALVSVVPDGLMRLDVEHIRNNTIPTGVCKYNPIGFRTREAAEIIRKRRFGTIKSKVSGKHIIKCIDCGYFHIVNKIPRAYKQTNDSHSVDGKDR